jgi:X-Pro dipeptidyl-peptidase (S15 family)
MRSTGRRPGWIAASTLVAVVLLTPTLAAGPALGERGKWAAGVTPLGLSDCERTEGVYQCSGLVETWDGVPLDTTVTLPSARGQRLPLLVMLHGLANSKWEFLDPERKEYMDHAFAWARDGYAVLTHTFRGFWGSCGTPESRLANPSACADGYIHLADVRYEGRDPQYLIGRLVDEGIAAPGRIGVIGESGGGGPTMMLAALRDRVMLPGGRLVPWRSPDGTPLRLAAAGAVIPWTDLVDAALPNGRVSATGITSRRMATQPIGVAKATIVNAILAAAQNAVGPGQPVGEPFVPGRPMGYLAPPGSDPEADVTSWVARINAGEPYTGRYVEFIRDQVIRFHSAYYIPPTHPPPPLFMASGFTDDIFPVDHVLRFANRTAKLYPRVPLSLLLGDFGHQRSSNDPRDRRRLLRSIHAWIDHYVKGEGNSPREGATAFAQTCPRSRPSLGPFHARTFDALSRGELRVRRRGTQRLTSSGGDRAVGVALDPAAGGGKGCVELAAERAPGTARYRLATARRRAFMLIGQPALRARLEISGAPPPEAQVAGRLWDVAPDGTQRLVARGLYRPRQGRNRWYLHPAAWRFERGHAAVLELLGNDAPYGRPSNDSFEIEVRWLRVTLPTRR